MADRAPERPETDRELLLLTVQELGHVKAHLAELTQVVEDEGKERNGRLERLEEIVRNVAVEVAEIRTSVAPRK
jgi:hypothetical protein